MTVANIPPIQEIKDGHDLDSHVGFTVIIAIKVLGIKF